VAAHLRECPACAAGWKEWSGTLDALAALPPPPAPDVAGAVLERLSIETRDPGLASMFRPLSVRRPLLVPSLVTASLVLLAVATPVTLQLERPLATPRVAFSSWGGWGGGAAPLAPSASVTLPREQDGGLAHRALSDMGEGTLFVETVVGVTGRVNRVRLLEGDEGLPSALLDALTRQRFEPGRYQGEAVPVALYRLISRLDVLASAT
jgi:hypothetical protein